MLDFDFFDLFVRYYCFVLKIEWSMVSLSRGSKEREAPNYHAIINILILA